MEIALESEVDPVSWTTRDGEFLAAACNRGLRGCQEVEPDWDIQEVQK